MPRGCDKVLIPHLEVWGLGDVSHSHEAESLQAEKAGVGPGQRSSECRRVPGPLSREHQRERLCLKCKVDLKRKEGQHGLEQLGCCNEADVLKAFGPAVKTPLRSHTIDVNVASLLGSTQCLDPRRSLGSGDSLQGKVCLGRREASQVQSSRG